MDERIILKRCTKCRKIKSIAEYYKGRNACMECKRKYNKQYNQSLTGHLRVLWNSIRDRCTNPKNIAYEYYGGRGIQNKFEFFGVFYDYIVNVLTIDPRGLEIDRIDNDGHYERGNIRFVDTIGNRRNRRGKSNGAIESRRNRRGKSNGTSKYKGVTWNKANKKWIAKLKCNRKNYHLGCFDSEIEAAHVYDRGALKYFGEFAYLNFPKDSYEKDNISKSVDC